MNPSEVLRRLYKEKKEWQRMDAKSPEIAWTLRGIGLCLNHVHAIIREQRENERLKHPKVNHQYATMLYHACRSAVTDLGRSQKKRALILLRRTLDKIPVRIQRRLV